MISKIKTEINCELCNNYFIKKIKTQRFCSVSCSAKVVAKIRKKRIINKICSKHNYNKKEIINGFKKRFRCSICIKEKNRERYINNKHEILLKQKEYTKNNKDKKRKSDKDYSIKNKENLKIKHKIYREKNKILLKIKKKEYYDKTKEADKARSKIYRLKNKDRISKNKRLYKNNKIKNDKIYALRTTISRSIHRYLAKSGRKKNKSCIDYIGYDPKILVFHIENYFNRPENEWMCWENRGIYNPKTWDDNDKSTWTWQLDHIIPQSKFDFSNEKKIKECWALSNLRPYPAKLNIIEQDNR